MTHRKKPGLYLSPARCTCQLLECSVGLACQGCHPSVVLMPPFLCSKSPLTPHPFISSDIVALGRPAAWYGLRMLEIWGQFSLLLAYIMYSTQAYQTGNKSGIQISCKAFSSWIYGGEKSGAKFYNSGLLIKMTKLQNRVIFSACHFYHLFSSKRHNSVISAISGLRK